MVDKIIEEVKKQLTGDPVADIKYLNEEAMKYTGHEKANDIIRELSDMAYNLLPEEKKQYLKDMILIGDKRIDQVFHDANELFKQRRLEEAVELMKKIEEKADAFRNSPGNEELYSFRNRFEEHLYREVFKPEKDFGRTPFDFCMYLTAYGYTLVEMRKGKEAVPVLEKAISFNPVNTGTRFELIETYKMLHEPAKQLYTIKDTLSFVYDPEDMARCYCDLGYYCVEIKDYDSAVAFYYTSLLYAPNDRVTGEIQHIAMLKGKQIDPPERKDIEKAFSKYKIKEGPNSAVINLAYSLGEYCIEHNAHPQESLFYYSIVYNFTRDEKIKEKLDKLVEQARTADISKKER